MSKRHLIVSSIAWKTVEQYSILGIQFVLQIILARILSPDDYGVLSIVMVFISISNIFVQKGFATAIVQKKEVDEVDLSSVFFFTLCVAGVLYLLIFFMAPFIARFYDMPILSALMRTMALVLFVGAVNSIQNAILQRRMKFKLAFFSSFVSVIMSGIIGIISALRGFGVWALAIQQVSYNVFIMLTLLFGIRWFPKFKFSFARVKTLISFGWKVLVNNVIDEFFVEIRSLVIGKRYTSSALAFYSRGKQFPHLVMKSVNGSIQAVMLPILSKEQDNISALKEMTKRSINISSFIMFPFLAGLAAVAPTLIPIILTEKWMPCVIFVQIHCIYYAVWPITTLNLHALYAVGRSDIVLKMEVIRKVIDFVVLLITICFGVTAVAWGAALVSIISVFIYLIPSQKIIHYSMLQQVKDIMPAMALSVIMGICVIFIGTLGNATIGTLVVQIISGACIYVVLAYVFHVESMHYLIGFLQEEFKKKKK